MYGYTRKELETTARAEIKGKGKLLDWWLLLPSSGEQTCPTLKVWYVRKGFLPYQDGAKDYVQIAL